MTDKIKMDMTGIQCMTALAAGNVGAISVLTMIARDAEKHDPYALGALGVFMDLDELSIYGSRIWQFYKDVCGQKVGKMLAVLRAYQLGFLSEDILNEQIGDDTRRGEPFANFDDIAAFVQQNLPDFKLEVSL